jgi:threonine/homoserine efflux transporter RhtA
MIAFSAIWFLLIAGIAGFPMLALRKRQSTTWWDYVYPFTGIIAWFPLGMSNVGSTVSLSNFVVEMFWIAVLSVVIPWGRWFISKSERKQIKALSLALTFLPIVAAVVIRLTMPTLPE